MKLLPQGTHAAQKARKALDMARQAMAAGERDKADYWYSEYRYHVAELPYTYHERAALLHGGDEVRAYLGCEEAAR